MLKRYREDEVLTAGGTLLIVIGLATTALGGSAQTNTSADFLISAGLISHIAVQLTSWWRAVEQPGASC